MERTVPSETTNSRIEFWKSKLIDLSLRNKLLNFRPERVSSVTIVLTAVAWVVCGGMFLLSDGLAPLLGVYGVSWGAMLSAGALVLLVMGRPRHRLAAAARTEGLSVWAD